MGYAMSHHQCSCGEVSVEGIKISVALPNGGEHDMILRD